MRKLTLLSFYRNCAYYPGAKPGKKYALNKQYALLSQLRLLTRVYGTLAARSYALLDTYIRGGGSLVPRPEEEEEEEKGPGFNRSHMRLIAVEFHRLRILLRCFRTLVTPISILNITLSIDL